MRTWNPWQEEQSHARKSCNEVREREDEMLAISSFFLVSSFLLFVSFSRHHEAQCIAPAAMHRCARARARAPALSRIFRAPRRPERVGIYLVISRQQPCPAKHEKANFLPAHPVWPTPHVAAHFASLALQRAVYAT